MRRLLLVLLPFGLLAACSGYALDYAKPRTSIVAPELARYGLTAEQSQCVGTALGSSLSVWQLRQLTDAAAAGVRQDQGTLTAQDLVWIASQVKDPKVTLEVAKAAGACGLVSEAAPAEAAPDPGAPQSTSPAGPDAQSPDGKAQNGPADYQPSADLLSALEAYEKGDFAAAARLATEAAGQGDSGANQFLGGLYAFGRGVPNDYALAARHYAIAAGEGWSEAMNNLGKAYETGQGVPLDRVEALKWYLLASLRATEDEQMVQRNMQQIVRTMTTADIERAATLAYEWNRGRGG